MAEMKKIHSFDGVFDAQKVFRLILTAASNPTRIVNIKPFAGKLYGGEPELLAVAMTLLDNEVSFRVCGAQGLSGDIISLTLSEEETLEGADYIFVTDPAELESAISNAKCGTLRDPHKSATLIIKDAGGRIRRLRLSGPGIKGTAELNATELVENALDIRDCQLYEYPQGIDFIFVSEGGDLFAVPRLIRKEAL